MRLRVLIGALLLGAVLLAPRPASAQFIFPSPYGPPTLVVYPGYWYPGVVTFPNFNPFVPLNQTGFQLPVNPYNRIAAQQNRGANVGGGYGGAAAGTGAGDRYYLDPQNRVRPRRTPGRTRTTPPAQLPPIRVEPTDPGFYRITWTGPTADIAEVEYRALDADGRLLRSRIVSIAPFRGLLRVPDNTSAVDVIVQRENGAQTAYGLSLDDLKSLIR
ncbi:MAG TPA: hypothetical protein VFU47_00165 [Armatimonadota bacterium]|nr:hypothetical protein [Armatimonadota bacterium]